jgi:hypothetical protein
VFDYSASAASSIALQIGGQLFGAVFLAGLVVAQLTSGLAAQASASRLLYAMGGLRASQGGLRPAQRQVPHPGGVFCIRWSKKVEQLSCGRILRLWILQCCQRGTLMNSGSC